MRRAALQMLHSRSALRSTSATIFMQRDHLAELARHRRLQREDLVAVLLEVERAGVDLVVAADDVVGPLEVAVEQDGGGARDRSR